jgi:tRNA(Ile)-lysidine synthase
MTGPLRLRHKVGEYIANQGLWQTGDRVAVAVSGGMDSMVLLDVLVETQRWHGGVLEVVTVDHQSGAHSGEHATFVETEASALGLACTRAAVESAAPSEAVWRAARYQVFDSLDVEAVAMGHHLDDQAATVILQLLRGAGSKGLRGMVPKRARYVRPLLDIPREELRAWAVRRELRWKEDPTNQDPRFLRNRVREEVLPLLEDLRPGARNTLGRASRLLALEDAYFEDRCAEADGSPWPLTWFSTAPEALIRRVVARELKGVHAGQIDAALDLAKRGQGRLEIGEFLLEVNEAHIHVGIRRGKKG